MNRPKVLVTGANGFIGAALCQKLLERGWPVVGTFRNEPTVSQRALEYKSVKIDLLDPGSHWKAVLENVDTIVHLAARVHVLNETAADALAAYRQINVDGTLNLIRAAESAGVRRFIYMSTIKVNGEGKPDPYTEQDRPRPKGPYAVSKYETEQKLHERNNKTDLELVVVRPPLIYGPQVKANFLQLLNVVDKGLPLPLANVKNCRSMIFLDNLIDAILVCIQHPSAPGKTYLVSDNQDMSTPELLQKTAALLGKSSRLFPFPIPLLRLIAKPIGKSVAIKGLLDSLRVDISKIRAELNWNPRFTMEEGLRQTAKWYRAEFG
jgi:nucleoside-diphosphate-sugar epimerase